MKTRTDRTLFFDFLPLELGDISGYRTRMLLYTVPGQVYYNATRKLVLKGADAVVFVADSTPSKMEENIESLHNLEENLNEHDLTLDTIPWVIQYNKRDAEGALSVKALSDKLNPLNVPVFEAVATNGTGVYETFQAVAGMLYSGLMERLSDKPPRKKSAEPPVAPATSVKPTASSPAATGVAVDEEQSVTEVVDVALREIDTPDPAEQKPAKKSKKPARARKGKPAAQEKKMDEIDETAGRVIDLEDTETHEKPADGEFVLDPFQSSQKKEAEAAPRPKAPPPPAAAAPPPAAAAPPPAAAAAPPPAEDDGITITIPVIITRSQVKKSIPLKINLDIQVVDEEV